MQVRIALALCVVLCGALCGHSLALTYRRRASALRELTEGLKVLKIHMTGMFEPIQDALRRSECPLLRSVSGRMRPGVSASEAWKEVSKAHSRKDASTDVLAESDRAILDRLFEHLGESGRAEQNLLLEGTVQTLEAQLEKAARSAAEADRLYLKLGVLIGLMLALIVV
ncbi:MAG: stage III sporulation protein AB [Clostridia bacterium]|nr:stage III sporulation protein AB [Clostridia bacterium]